MTGEAFFLRQLERFNIGLKPVLDMNGQPFPLRPIWGALGVLLKSNTVSLLSPYAQVLFVYLFVIPSSNNEHTFSASPASAKTGQAGSLSGSPKTFSPQASTPVTTKTDKTCTTGSILNLNLGQWEFWEVSFCGNYECACKLWCLFCVVFELWTFWANYLKGTLDRDEEWLVRGASKGFPGACWCAELFNLEVP